jgi:acetyl-CoA acetyltransferase
MGNDVYILGVGMIRFGKYAERSVKQLVAEAMQALFEDCPWRERTSKRPGSPTPAGE